MSTVDLSEFISYADAVKSKINPDKFFHSLEACLTKGKKEGKGKKTIVNTFVDPNLKLSSWKFAEWDYSNPKITLPTNARGLFTLDSEKKIIARGYDKFFNTNEVNDTKVENLQAKLKGPFEVTLKSNGCIILISGLENGQLVVCSKHSTGPRDDTTKNHALQGQLFLEQQLKKIGISPKELALSLNRLNVTAVAEYCDDAFEEHVLKYTGDDAGLYLHGLNFNIPEFKTFPFDYVTKFGRMFGFKITDYFLESDFDKMMEFFKESSKTGMYKGIEIEGFVIRCKNKDDNSDFFWKYKFEQPYLMYRGWREATKRFMKYKGNLSDEIMNKFSKDTKDYLEFIAPILKEHEIIGQYYRAGHGIVDLRNLYLKHIGKKGYELTNDASTAEYDSDEINTASVSKQELNKDVDELVQNLKNLEIDPKEFEAVNAQLEETVEDPSEYIYVTKYIIIPIATIGCGKTTVAMTLKNLFPKWGHIQSDNVIKVKGGGNRLVTKSLEFLAGDTEAINDENLNKEALEFLKNPKKYSNKNKANGNNKDNINGQEQQEEILCATEILDKNNVIIVDRNNHMYRERKDLIQTFNSLKRKYLTNDNELVESKNKKVKYNFKFIAWNFLPASNFPTKDITSHPQFWNITRSRVIERGDNHQSLKVADKEDEQHVISVMEGFINRFQLCDPSKPPDGWFDLVIDLDVFGKESSRKNVDKVLSALGERYPEMFHGKAIPSKKQIDAAFQKALSYKPTIVKIVSNKNNKSKNNNNMSTEPKLPRIAYFGIQVSNPQELLFKIETLLSKKLASLNTELNLFEQLQLKQRVQERFHVTVAHVSQKDKRQIFREYTTLFKKLTIDEQRTANASAKGYTQVGKILADVKLEKLVWDNKALAVVVKIARFKNTGNENENAQDQKAENFKFANKFLHITIGTISKDVKPVYSNELLNYAEAYISESAETKEEVEEMRKDGVFENNIHVLSWDDEEGVDAVYLENLPLVAYH